MHPAPPSTADSSTRSTGARRTIIVLWVMLAVLVGALGMRLIEHRGAADSARDPLARFQAFDVASAFAGGVVSQTGGLTAATVEAGNEDLLVILDARNEELYVYRTELRAGMQLLQRYPVSQLFTDARARALGGP